MRICVSWGWRIPSVASTSLLAMVGQIAIVFSLPALLAGAVAVNWPGLLLLIASPQLVSTRTARPVSRA